MHSAIDRLRQTLEPGGRLDWHSHDAPYAALVLDGGYAETGDGGRHQAAAGNVIVHPPFSAHADVVDTRGAVVVNLPLTVHDAMRLQSGSVADPGEVIRSYIEDPLCIGSVLQASVIPAAPGDDLPDLLAAALNRPAVGQLSAWAERHGVSLRTVTRQFSAAFGIAPAHFRWRARTRGAWFAVVTTDHSLADIAHDWAFADQAHMTRCIRRLTGRPPNTWRKQSLLSD